SCMQGVFYDQRQADAAKYRCSLRQQHLGRITDNQDIEPVPNAVKGDRAGDSPAYADCVPQVLRPAMRGNPQMGNANHTDSTRRLLEALDGVRMNRLVDIDH